MSHVSTSISENDSANDSVILEMTQAGQTIYQICDALGVTKAYVSKRKRVLAERFGKVAVKKPNSEKRSRKEKSGALAAMAEDDDAVPRARMDGLLIGHGQLVDDETLERRFQGVHYARRTVQRGVIVSAMTSGHIVSVGGSSLGAASERRALKMDIRENRPVML